MFNTKINYIIKQRQIAKFAFGLHLQKFQNFSTHVQASQANNALYEKDLANDSYRETKQVNFCNEKVSSQKLSEREFLVKLKNNPNSFGTENEEKVVDAGDLEEEKHYTEQPLPSQKLSTKQYADIIKRFIRQRMIKEAIDLVEVRMIKEDRVKPDSYMYNLLLGACGRVGYTKKAFSLYNDMKKRGLKVTPGTYTALFNACANSPWTEDCLTRATHLQNIMIEKMYEPNITNYNAMIKAFGRGKDLNTAFTLVDEMISKGLNIKDDTLNFLLQACISEKEVGFRHALLVWNKLLKRKIQPSIYTYNLMLRCIRDCGIGDVNVMKDVVKQLTGSGIEMPIPVESENNHTVRNESRQINYPDSSSDNSVDVHDKFISQSYLDTSRETETMYDCVTSPEQSPSISVSKNLHHDNSYEGLQPNLMADQPHLGSIISLSEIHKPEDRLLLVGGASGFLANMKNHNCTPDIKTFTLLLDNMPGSIAMEKQLIDAMKTAKIKPDLDFFNMLIKKRCMRFDYEGGKDVLQLIKKAGYRADLITYGVLALGCKTKEEAIELLQEMQEKKYRLNAEILGAMLHQATHHMNFQYVMEVMDILFKERIEANKQFMECLKSFYKQTKHISNDKGNKLYYSKKFRTEYTEFRKRYKAYIQDVKIDETQDAHPWQQFRQCTTNEKFKDKNARFKPVHKSYFKVKTSIKRPINRKQHN